MAFLLGGQSVPQRSAHRSQRLFSGEPELKGEDSLVKKERATVCRPCPDPFRLVQKACLGRVVNGVINQMVGLKA